MKKTVTIGIPAHNEEANIGKLIRQILSQKSSNFKLEKIIVYCDVCTDDTLRVAKNSSKKVFTIKGAKRVGKSGGINKICSVSTSDILICLDADIRIGNQNIVEEIVKKFDVQNTGLVGGNIYPEKPINLFQKLISERSLFWKEMTEKINKGKTIANNVGRIYSVKKFFYKKINIPNNLSADDDYIYLLNKKLGNNFEYCKKAIVYYQTPKTISDYIKQFSRFQNSEKVIVGLFGNLAKDEYDVDKTIKTKFYLNQLFNNPLRLFYALLSQFVLLIGKKIIKNEGIGAIWEPAKSTK